ncbi:uncharacterized protein LOC118495919 isoform X2 [Sander lucioperca]|uniref:uncharacterized protein LOC118495919 isoform X2 n=1 Tax=Sander lucioperca TaxID=283035 RepID=UPI001653AC23|nr:uncharacterized protein LOC118495919 isoform X2 [Sander lucioperca]
MAPVGMVGMLGWVSSPELGVISLVVFLVLSVTLLALCIRCQRKTANAYAVNETPTDGKGGANGNTDTRMGGISRLRDIMEDPPNACQYTGESYSINQLTKHQLSTLDMVPNGQMDGKREEGQEGTLALSSASSTPCLHHVSLHLSG